MSEYNTLNANLLDNGVVELTITRASKMNALNSEVFNELRSFMDYVADQPKVRGIIITGDGEKAFAAGADIAELTDLTDISARKFSERGQEVFLMLEECTKPIIAAINGFALGGGLELAMACHIRIASANAQFGLPETTLGLIPGYGGTQRLTQLIGKGRALELMLTADRISAEQAERFGLVNHVVATQAELMPKAHEMMAKILVKAPIAIMHVIDSVNSYFSDDNGYQSEANAFANCCRTEDFKEGTAAFLEKRKPNFRGR